MEDVEDVEDLLLQSPWTETSASILPLIVEDVPITVSLSSQMKPLAELHDTCEGPIEIPRILLPRVTILSPTYPPRT